MKTVFDPKPVKTYTFQMSFNIGWRHEPEKEKGILRETLENLVEKIKTITPPWCDAYYFLDAEFSSIIFMGLSETQGSIIRVVEFVENNFPEKLKELKAGLELFVISGGVKKDVVEELESFKSEHRGKTPRLVKQPKRFLSLKELTRAQKHFLVFVAMNKGCELYLEISRRGDRIQYGLKLHDLSFNSLEEEIKKYEFWMRRRYESTKETAAILTVMNMFNKDKVDFESVIENVKGLNVSEFSQAIKTLENIIKRKK